MLKFLFGIALTFCKIIWENRFKKDIGNDCLISVDGTDFWVAEQGPPFFSHKFRKSAL